MSIDREEGEISSDQERSKEVVCNCKYVKAVCGKEGGEECVTTKVGLYNKKVFRARDATPSLFKIGLQINLINQQINQN